MEILFSGQKIMARKLVTKLSKRPCFTLIEKDTLKSASEKLKKYNVGD